MQFFLAYLKWHGQGLFKNVYFIFFWTFYCKHFYYKTGFSKQNQFLQFWNFFLRILMMYDFSFLDINWPYPPNVSWFSSTPAGIGLTLWNYRPSQSVTRDSEKHKFFLLIFPFLVEKAKAQITYWPARCIDSANKKS